MPTTLTPPTERAVLWGERDHTGLTFAHRCILSDYRVMPVRRLARMVERYADAARWGLNVTDPDVAACLARILAAPVTR